MKRITIIIITLTLSSMLMGQISISRQVIGSTGSYQTGTNITLSSTVGEPATQTLFSLNNILTQGFQQPKTSGDSLITYEVINETCRGANNGSILVTDVVGCQPPYQVIIIPVFSATPSGSINLGAGDYYIEIVGTNGCNASDTVNVGLDSDEDCALKFYSGLTPNNDNENDVWWVDNIELFPENNIKIFNRWGNVVWSAESYDNKEKVWKGYNNNGGELPDGTYFYVADVEGVIYKGWVELTR